MTRLADRINEDPAALEVRLEHQLTDLPALLASLLPELVTLAGECETVATARQRRGAGVVTGDVLIMRSEQRAADRAAQHENRELALKLTGPVPAPVSVPAVAVAVEIDRFVFDIVDDLHRRLRRARPDLCLISEPWRGFRERPLTRGEAAAYAVALLSVYTRPSELRRVHTEGEELATAARRFLDGEEVMAHPEPCPWCGRRSLLVNQTTGVITCDEDRDTGQRQPCWCTDSYCPCKASPVGHRHQWHRAPVDVRKAIRDAGGDPDDPDHALQIHAQDDQKRPRSQTWYGLRDQLNDAARTTKSTTHTEE